MLIFEFDLETLSFNQQKLKAVQAQNSFSVVALIKVKSTKLSLKGHLTLLMNSLQKIFSIEEGQHSWFKIQNSMTLIFSQETLMILKICKK